MSEPVLQGPGNRQVEFGDAIKLFLRNYATFQGRSSRGAYWWSVLAYWLVLSAAALLDGAAVNGGNAGPLTGLVGIALLLPNIAVTVRRLHDTGKSGWWWLLLQLPVVGWIFSLLFLTQPGQRMANAHGPDVEAGREDEPEIII